MDDNNKTIDFHLNKKKNYRLKYWKTQERRGLWNNYTKYHLRVIEHTKVEANSKKKKSRSKQKENKII